MLANYKVISIYGDKRFIYMKIGRNDKQARTLKYS